MDDYTLIALAIAAALAIFALAVFWEATGSPVIGVVAAILMFVGFLVIAHWNARPPTRKEK